MTIVEFLEARLAEDEATADAGLTCEQVHPTADINCYGGHPHPRAVREVAAKRAILSDHSLEEFKTDRGVVYQHSCSRCIDSLHWMDHEGGEMVQYPCITIRALASVYADHPDFDPAWAVKTAQVP